MDMKTTSEYMALLRKYMVENAHKYGIMRMGIFGSVARGEQTEDSDVDVCVELQTPSMFCLVHIKDELQHLFGCAVDIEMVKSWQIPNRSKLYAGYSMPTPQGRHFNRLPMHCLPKVSPTVRMHLAGTKTW